MLSGGGSSGALVDVVDAGSRVDPAASSPAGAVSHTAAADPHCSVGLAARETGVPPSSTDAPSLSMQEWDELLCKAVAAQRSLRGGPPAALQPAPAADSPAAAATDELRASRAAVARAGGGSIDGVIVHPAAAGAAECMGAESEGGEEAEKEAVRAEQTWDAAATGAAAHIAALHVVAVTSPAAAAGVRHATSYLRPPSATAIDACGSCEETTDDSESDLEDACGN